MESRITQVGNWLFFVLGNDVLAGDPEASVYEKAGVCVACQSMLRIFYFF
jgi:hypothetical protein